MGVTIGQQQRKVYLRIVQTKNQRDSMTTITVMKIEQNLLLQLIPPVSLNEEQVHLLLHLLQLQFHFREETVILI